MNRFFANQLVITGITLSVTFASCENRHSQSSKNNAFNANTEKVFLSNKKDINYYSSKMLSGVS